MPSKAIHRFSERENEQIFAWARYVYWADVSASNTTHMKKPPMNRRRASDSF